MEQLILEQSRSLELVPPEGLTEVTFLFTDLVDSTILWELYPGEMGAALERHDRIIRTAVTGAGGEVFKGTGDGLLAVVPDVSAALSAAEAAQRALASEDWGGVEPLEVRMAIHVGEAERRTGDYFGPALNRAARLLVAGHGGQVLLSSAACGKLDDAGEHSVELADLGEHRFRSLGQPERVRQLVIEGLRSEFPPLRLDASPVQIHRGGFARSVRGYELREMIGEGDFGIVYRAYQASVGREVALKAIRPEYANDPAFVRSFEGEAQFVAQLEHPHIVALYDYWREPDNAYLAMRWMRGGSLRAALDRGPWKLDRATRLLDQVGSALAYAHRHGVLHRDLKPTNVLLDEDGNAYLSDFGIAAHLKDPSSGSRAAPPAYRPPESGQVDALSPRSDIYGLGLLLYEVLTAQRPSRSGPLPLISSIRSDVPEELDAVIARATARDLAGRFETVGHLISAVHAAVEAVGVLTLAPQTVPEDLRNPYKGLRPFYEADADDFFGRRELIGELLEKTASRRLTALVGPSGSGKSSVVRAGLVPRLRAGGLPGSDDWFIADMYPGSFPFEEMESALLKIAVREPTAVLDQLATDERGLMRVSKQILPDDDSQLLLLVDQFEELFTLVDEEETRRLFLDCLVTAVGDPRSRIRVILTLRADSSTARSGTRPSASFSGTAWCRSRRSLPRAWPKRSDVPPRRWASSSSRTWFRRSSPTSTSSRVGFRFSSTP
jgi:serine/threonine protein kinase/class 3 adenylate cyclase